MYQKITGPPRLFWLLIIFALFGLAGLNINLLVTVGSVLAAAAVALYASTTQPKPTHNDHGHHH